MKQISNKEYEKYQQYQNDRLHGRILTPDGLRVICAGLDNDPEKIGIHMLEMLAKFRNSRSESEADRAEHLSSAGTIRHFCKRVAAVAWLRDSAGDLQMAAWR